MPRRTDHLPARRYAQAGLALPMVLLLGIVLFLVVTTVAFRGVIGVHQADDQRRYNESLQAADGGVDKVLDELIDDKEFTTQTPAFGGALQTDTPPSPTQSEKEWALQKAQSKLPSQTGDQAVVNPALAKLVKSQGAEWAVVKPAGQATVFAVGYVPSRANATRTRVLRVEYDFPPFNAVNAILTGGNLRIGGNANIAGSAGSVHTNGSFSYQGGAWGVSGSVGASGSFPNGNIPQIGNQAGSGGGKATQDIPVLHPDDPATYKFSQYDLCPDGTAHAGPAHPTLPSGSLTPCTGAALPFTSTFNGWTRTVGAGLGLSSPTTWKYQSSDCNNGVYFIHLGKVSIQGNPGTSVASCGAGQPWEVTIMASSLHTGPANTCPHFGGDIDIQGTPKMRPHASTGGLLIAAGRDFSMKGNASGGGANLQGSITVHEQFDVSGNMTLFGNIIANDNCDTAGSPVSQNLVNLQGSSSITFDSPVELPLGKLIRITRWTEL